MSKTGIYVEQKGSQFTLKDDATLSGDPSDDHKGTKLHVANPRDIANSVGSDRSIMVCDLGIDYPGGDRSTVFAIDNCIIEYRGALGKVKTRSNGSNSFDSTYGKTYLSVGIPRPRYDWIVRQVSTQSKCTVKADAALLDDDYAWLVTRLPPDDKSVKVYIAQLDDNNKPEASELGTPMDVLDALKRNLLCIASLTMRLKKSAPAAGKSTPLAYTIGATLVSAQVVDITDVSAPPLQQAVGPVINTSRLASDTLTSMLSSLGGEEVQETQEQDISTKVENE